MWATIFVVALWLAPALSQLTLVQQTCQADRRHVSVDTSTANVLIGGLFDIREAGTNGFGCGMPNKELIQLYEAARWTIGLLNTNNYVPGVRFGLEAYDICTYEGNALESIGDFYPQIVSRGGTNYNGVAYCTKSNSQYKLGLIGPLQSTVSMAVAEMAPRIPASLISMRSSAPALSDKNMYPTFLRTDQPVSVFARAVTELFRELQWEKIVIVYGDDDYGKGGYEEVLRAAAQAGVCVSGAIAVPRLGSEPEHRAKLLNLASYGATAAVFYGDSFDALTTLKALGNIPSVRNIKWLFGQLELETDYSSYPAAQGAIVGLATTTTIDAFKTYYTALNVNNPPSENPWLQDWYMNKYQCKLTGINYQPFVNMRECQTLTINRVQDFRQSSYVEQTVLAVVAYAEAIKSVCSGQSGVCRRLSTMDPLTFHRDHLSKVDITLPNNFPIVELRGRRMGFDVNGDPLRSAYTFYNYNNNGGSFTFQQFATYSNGNLQVTTTPTFPRPGSPNLPIASQCPSTGCTNCLMPTKGIKLVYKPGDLVVAALVNTQESSTSQASLNCGESIPDRLIEAVAARYGAMTVQALNGHGVSLGYLVVDVCPGVVAARSFLTNLLGGYKLYTDDSGVMISTSNLVAVLDMTREDTGVAVAGMLASLGLPHLRVAPTTMDFLRDPHYPRLISVVPSQDTVQLSLVQMLGALKWNYVQIVSESHGHYYRAAMNFRRLASRMDICVGLWSTFDMAPTALVNRMRNVQDAPVVVVFSTAQHMRDLLAAVKTITANSGSQRQLTFVSGSEEWGTSDNVFKGNEDEAQGLVSVALKERASSRMTVWLNSLSLSNIAGDRFLAEWFERKFSCSLTAASRGSYSQVCTTPTSLSGTNVYLGYGPYIINAISTVASALSTILNANCPGSTGICPQVRNSLAQLLVDELRDSLDQSSEFQIHNGEGMSDLEYFNYRNRAYNMVGGFDTNTRRISSLTSNSIITATGATASSVNTQCAGHCRPCQHTYMSQEFGYVPGDWLIAATFGVSGPGPDGQRPYVCGDVGSNVGFQFTAAMMYALSRLNSGQGPVKLNNVTLGGLIMDHCSNERRAYGQVADVYSGLTELTWPHTMGNMAGRFTSNNVLAWLTDTSSAAQEATEILQPIGVSIVSPSATASSLMDNPTFFRTVQGDGTTAVAIAKLCKMLGFKYIQVVYAPNSYGREGLSTMINVARQEGLCVLNSYEMANVSSASVTVNTLSAGSTKVVVLFMEEDLTKAFLEEAAQLSSDKLTIICPEPFISEVNSTPNRQNLRNLLTLQLQNPVIADFNNFLNDVDQNLHNPFYARFYMKIFGCNLPGYYMYTRDCTNQRLTDSGNYVASNFALSTINAVYAVAGALQTTLVELCGVYYTDNCTAFMQSGNMYNRFVDNLKLVQFQEPSSRLFRFLEREGNVLYNILRFDGNQFNTIGTYGGASMELRNAAELATYYNDVESSCSIQCSECVFTDLSFSYTPGDIYLGGVFDVHKQGQGVFDCGAINPENGFQLLEAFHFALQQVNSKKGKFADILPGVTLGGVGLDACQSPIRGGYLVSNINNGLATLVRGGKEIRPEEIDAYIGSYSSEGSIYLARILTDLQMPQISYASTSTSLDDQRLYPYFFRTVPADDKQVLGTLRYLDQNNLRYVQVVHTSDAYGEMGKTQFDLMIRQYNFSVCVAQRVAIPEGATVSQESSDDVVTELLGKPVANTVVIFASTAHIRAFLEAVARSPQAVRNRFRFVGPTTWGDKHSVTEGIPDVADDSVTFALDFQGGVGNFLDSYLAKRNPTNAGNNPWFTEWFEHILNCYTSPTNSHMYPRPCDPNLDLTTKVIEDNVVLHVMNAVYSAAFALDDTLKQKCGDNYAAVCEAYHTSTDRRTVLRNSLESVNFTDDTNVPFYFVDREGNKGYKLFKLSSSPLDTDVIYNQDPIGSFSSDGVLYLDMKMAPRYDGSCERKDACVECPTIRSRGMRYAVGGDPNGYITLIGVFDVHNRGNELYQCGSINMEGFKKFLTFWYFRDEAKKKNIRLLALDTCSSSLRVGQDLYGLLKDGKLCNSEDFDLDNLGMANIGAVVVTEEDNTMAASRILDPLRVTYLSADSVSPFMDPYQYLLRTITPWSGYARMLVKFLVHTGWTYVNSLYVNSGEGQEQYQAFRQISTENGVCLTSGLTLPEDAHDPDIRIALSQLDRGSGAKVVVLFTDPPLTVRVLQQAQQMGIADDFLWVFAMEEEYMNASFPADLSFQALVLQAVVPQRKEVEEKMKLLKYNSSYDNRNEANIPRVWWEDYFQTTHQCSLPDAQYPLEFALNCTMTEMATQLELPLNAHYTYLASLFSLNGLNSFNANCRGGETLQGCLARMATSRQAVRDHILASKEERDGRTYKFIQPLRYIEGKYNVSLKNGQLSEKHWIFENGEITPNEAVLNIKSECQRSDGCGCGTQNTGTSQGQTEFNPTMPRNYYKYDSKGDKLYDWPIWAIVMGVLTGIGLLITLIVFLYLLFFYPVRSGTSVLGYLTMIGIMGVYAVNFAFFLHASDATCGARRFVMGVVYVIVFAPLLVKAIDNWRFADLEYGNRPYRGLTSSFTLFLIALGLILVQCIIPIEWLILVQPTASQWTTSLQHDYWWCDPPDMYDIGLVCSFIFVIFVVILTGIFAAFAWDSESNNRESRWILMSAITTAGCFMVWMIVTTNAGPVYRDPAVAIANFINATLLLIFIPIRKMHLLCQSQNDKSEVYDAGDYTYSNAFPNQSYDPDGDEVFAYGDASVKPDEDGYNITD